MIVFSLLYMLVFILPFISMVYIYIKLRRLEQSGSPWLLFSIRRFLAITIIAMILKALIGISQVVISMTLSAGEVTRYFKLLSYFSNYTVFPLSMLGFVILIIDIYSNRKRESYD